MFVDVTTEIRIARPIDLVANFAADPANAPLWYANIRSVEWRTEPAVAVGACAAFVANFLGRRLEYTYRVAAFEAGRLLTMRTADGPFPMETTYRWQSLEAQETLMTLTNRGEPSGFSALVAPFVSMAMRRANNKDLRRLKTILEAEE